MEKSPRKVAIIGSGLAGLSTAHILSASPSHAVTLFEQSPDLSFDAASLSVSTAGRSERIDLPMRALAGGYYDNVMRMYAHLGICVHPVRFLFVFVFAKAWQQHKDRAYFVHASNLHQMPPWPENRSAVLYLVEVLFLIVCHIWFSAACFLIPPRTSTIISTSLASSTSDEVIERPGESLGEYVHRIWLPRRYTTHYLLPLMSSVATCSHDEMLAFPASDVANYKRRSTGRQHYVVCGGVRRVQERLVEGITDIRLSTRVVRVQRVPNGVIVRWQAAPDSSSEEVMEEEEEVFDRVVLAVSPDVAGCIFTPVEPLVRCIPTRQVESCVLSTSRGVHLSVSEDDVGYLDSCSHESEAAQVITFRTRFAGRETQTEALHAMPSGVLVQTCPLDDRAGDHDADSGKGVLKRARFTRTLRTVESQRLVRRMTRQGSQQGRIHVEEVEGEEGEKEEQGEWRNGQGGVWLVGAWCWDGMVLLEGCVVSAMAVARDLGVRIPWDR